MGADAGLGLAPCQALARVELQRRRMGAVERLDLVLIGAEPPPPLGAGGADVIRDTGDLYHNVVATFVAQPAHDDGGHVRGEVGGIALALEAERTEKMVRAEADALRHGRFPRDARR